MGNLHYGANGGLSAADLADLRRQRVESERAAVDVYLAERGEGGRELIAEWCRIPTCAIGMAAHFEGVLSAWWSAPAPWTVRRKVRGQDLALEIAGRHGVGLSYADATGCAPGLGPIVVEDGAAKVVLTWQTPDGLRSRTAWGGVSDVEGFCREIVPMLAQSFDE